MQSWLLKAESLSRKFAEDVEVDRSMVNPFAQLGSKQIPGMKSTLLAEPGMCATTHCYVIN